MARKVKEFTKSNVMAFHKELEEAFQKVAEKFGVEVKLGNVRYQSTEYTTSATIKLLGEGGKTQLRPGVVQLMDMLGIQAKGSHGREIVDFNSRKKAGWIYTQEGKSGRYVCDDAAAKVIFAKAK